MRVVVHADPNEEKKARGAVQAAVERVLSKKDVVIADGLNYIKGFRYQLHCIAKALGTPQCVVCASANVCERGRVHELSSERSRCWGLT